MMKFIKKKDPLGFFQYSEETLSSTETNDTSVESPWSQLLFDTLKVGVVLSEGRHARSPQKAYFVEFLRVFDLLPSMSCLDVNFEDVGMILFFIWKSHKKKLRSTSSPKTAHLKCLKTYYLRCTMALLWLETFL